MGEDKTPQAPGVLGWFQWVWRMFVRWLRVRKRVRELEEKLANVECRVGDLEGGAKEAESSGSPRPRDLKYGDSLLWGSLGASDKPTPLCPACGGDGKYVPLTIREQRGPTGPFIALACPKCHWGASHKPDAWVEIQARNQQ